jgi:hypothetical protein
MLKPLFLLPEVWSPDKARRIMTAISKWFYRFSTGWIALLGLIIFLVFSALTLPSQSAALERYSQGLGSPDTTLYRAADLLRMAEVYGSEGRREFVKARWTFDLAFPLVYTFFLVTSISWLLNKGIQLNSKWRMLNLVPFIGMVFDFLENSATSLVMANFPSHLSVAEMSAPFFTLFKWLFIDASFVVLLAAGSIALFKKSGKRKELVG